jgi:hypothetical protein
MFYSNSKGVDFPTTTAALHEYLKMLLPFSLIFSTCLFFKKFVQENLAGENTFDAFSNVSIVTDKAFQH